MDRARARALVVVALISCASIAAALLGVHSAPAIEVGDERPLPPAAASTLGQIGMFAAADGSGNQVVFDGVAAGTPIDSTWVFDGSTWSHPCGAGTATPCGPTARQSYGIGTVDGQVVVFGGLTSNFGSPGGIALGDTWQFNGSTWDELCSSAACGPGARAAPAMAGDGSRALMFGGFGPGPLNDTWQFDGTSWTPVCGGALPACGVPGLIGPTMLWDGTQFVLFGGTPDFSTASADTYVFSGSSWTQVCGQGMASCGPAGRALAPAATLAGGGALMTGGLLLPAGGSVLAATDLWRWTGSAWSQEAVPWDSEPFDFNVPTFNACGPAFTVLASEGAGARMTGMFATGTGGPGQHPTSFLLADSVGAPLDRDAICGGPVSTSTSTTSAPVAPVAPVAPGDPIAAPTGGTPGSTTGRASLPATGSVPTRSVWIVGLLLLTGTAALLASSRPRAGGGPSTGSRPGTTPR